MHSGQRGCGLLILTPESMESILIQLLNWALAAATQRHCCKNICEKNTWDVINFLEFYEKLVKKHEKHRLFNITIYCLNILYFITVGTNLRVKECGLYFLLLFLPVCFLGNFFAFSVLLFSISKVKVIVKLS